MILSIQRSLVDYDSTLLAPHRSFIMKGTLLKSSRKTLSPRFFFLVSWYRELPLIRTPEASHCRSPLYSGHFDWSQGWYVHIYHNVEFTVKHLFRLYAVSHWTPSNPALSKCPY